MTNEPSPRPWRFEFRPPRMEKPHSDHEKAHFVDANGRDVWLSRKNAALIVDAVNERDRLRDIVRRLVRVAIRDRETLRYIYSGVEYATEDDDAIGDALREARAAIGEDKP